MPDTSHTPEGSSRAWYCSSIAEFLGTDSDSIVGRLARNSEFTVLPAQRDAWLEQIGLLKAMSPVWQVHSLWSSTSRMGRRIDTVLLVGPIVFVVEFKVGETVFDRAALDQVWDYALDLKNFHEASHSPPIIPILIATGARTSRPIELRADEDKVYRPIPVHPANFRATMDLALQTWMGKRSDQQFWPSAPYHPTPTIVEAARSALCSALGRGDRTFRRRRAELASDVQSN